MLLQPLLLGALYEELGDSAGAVHEAVLLEVVRLEVALFEVSESAQREKLIGPVMDLFLGTVVAATQKKIVVAGAVVNALGDAMYKMLLSGPAVFKPYLAGLEELQRKVLENIIRAMTVKYQQAQAKQSELEQKREKAEGAQEQKEVGKIKLVTSFGLKK